MEEGDLAVHGHEVYPSDVPSLGYPDGLGSAAPAPAQRRLDVGPSGSAAQKHSRRRTAPTLSWGRFSLAGGGEG